MFDKEFFPTPTPIIKKMLAPYKCKISEFNHDGYKTGEMTILEPSAGKGDILDFLKGNVKPQNVYCIEKNPELQMILKEKKYQLLGEDFLRYTGDLIFDLIIMNPPFSEGDKHLLHAWNILIEGDIVCLLNAETINNPYTNTRQQLKRIIEDHGEVEMLGDCFGTAERKTNIGVALVRLSKANDGERFNFFENKTKEKQHDINEDVIGNSLARKDMVGNMVVHYEECKKIFVEYMNLDKKLAFHMQPIFSEYSNKDFINDALKMDKSSQGYNCFVDGLRRKAWNMIFNKTKVTNYVTSKIRQDFEHYAMDQGAMDFTVENIEKLFETLFLNKNMIMEQCLLETFDKMCSYDKKNKIHFEGWKTNDAYKVNRKVIMPYFIQFDDYGTMYSKYTDGKSYGKYSMGYGRARDALSDIDKALCLITGEKIENFLGIQKALNNKFNRLGEIYRGDKYDNTCESHFFEMKFWKKGTLHMTFKDKSVWELFNITAAKGKKWLPEYDEEKSNKKSNKKSNQLVIF